MATKNITKKPKVRAQTRERDKQLFNIFVRLFTGEKFSLKKISNGMKISELKQYMEFATGVPVHMQRISYLDEGDLLDQTDIRSNDIVPGGTIQMSVWPMWKDLIEACATNDIDWVFRLGVTQPTAYHTPGSDYMTKRSRKNWLQERAFLALFIASHRGHEALVRKLIASGADVDTSTKLGRTSLHVAAAQGHGHIVDLLLEKGADIDAEDYNGLTALSIAAKFGHKTCERHLFLFRWQQRAKRMKPSTETPLMAHQFYDSKFPVWKNGTKCQMYFMNILPPGEYEGSGFSAPKSAICLSETNAQFVLDSCMDKNGHLPPLDQRRIKSPFLQLRLCPRCGPARLRKKNTASYDAWLGTKKAAEQKIIDVKNAAVEKLRLEEEERTNIRLERIRLERQEAEKSESYETWLANKEAEKTGGVTSQSPSKARQAHFEDQRPDNMASHPDGYLRSYLRSLDKSKRGNNYFNFEEWLDEKEEVVLGIRRLKSGVASG